MKILIEEYQYHSTDLRHILEGIDILENLEGKVSINYVGYYYNPASNIQDCVFILPKVLLEIVDKQELVFGKYRPEDIINLDKNNLLNTEEKNFIYEFAVWIYRSIVVFKGDKRNDTSIVYHKLIADIGHHHINQTNSFLDILLALVQFNRENQDFFMYIIKNLHAGLNKINWTRTIGTTSAIVQDNYAVYLNPVNKKRNINFDEELLIIFFSILNYINEQYGFPVTINCNYKLIKGSQFKRYLEGRGSIRLRQIKYKYFSDKALKLWNLCNAFFNRSQHISINTSHKEYLLVKNFNIVFEAIIDELIGDKENIPTGLKKQDDGKQIDHLYPYKQLINNGDEKEIYYIGDSKYYKRGNEIGKESVYKQFTYARNVIQWNLNLFMSSDNEDKNLFEDRKNYLNNAEKLRDDITEGYNIIPNFFISAVMDKDLSYRDTIGETEKKHTFFTSTQFKNRLFDRDTLLVCHFDVNFLYVVSLYGKNSATEKKAWKNKVREMFRVEIQNKLKQQYDFYAMAALPDKNAKQYIHDNFQSVLGKIYTPFKNKNILSLALDKADPENNNDIILSNLKEHFFIEKCPLGTDPAEMLKERGIDPDASNDLNKGDGILMVMMENFGNKFKHFEQEGKIAIGIKYIKESMEIVHHISDIKYILFHIRNNSEQHLFELRGECIIKEAEELDENIYRNINTAGFYLLVKINTDELDSSKIHSAKKTYTKKTRYEAQYATMEELS